jgi:hypothetical protein
MVFCFSEANKMEALDVILDEVRNRIEKRLCTCTYISSHVYLTLFCSVTTNVVDVQTITSIVAELTSNDDDINQESVEVILLMDNRLICLYIANQYYDSCMMHTTPQD